MAVEFRLLGEVSAYEDGRPVDTGHARQQCVLAVLLVEVNRVVPADLLLERAWGDQPPQRARGTLQSYLSRLRKTTGVPITRRCDGYVLCADPMAVDLHRFQALLERARGADDACAGDLLDEALGLWHGEAFGALTTPWLAGYRETLSRRRMAAQLDRHDVALRRGEHAAMLCDLTTAHAAHPLDERLAAQLMLALYRSGRQADAFDVFHGMRRRLADETGTDPGPHLMHVYSQILDADQPAPAAHRDHRVPRQLPAAPGVFTGRVAELAELDRSLRGTGDAVPIAVIGGIGGIGKTSLALRWAHANLEKFPDGQLYVNLRGFDPSADPLPWAVAVRGFLDALGVAPARVPAEPDDQAALFRSLVAGRRLLVVLDNARDAASVVPLLPGTARSAVLVTSRRQLVSLITTHAASPLTLDVLSGTDSRDLLARYVGTARLAGEDTAVAGIARQCAGLPLALGIVAARAALRPTVPLRAVAEELRVAGALDALDGGELAVSLRAVLACSVRELTPAAARVFGLLGLAPGPDISAPAAGSLTALPADQLRAALRELTGAHLVQEHQPGRFRMHDLVRLYATELAGCDPAALRRLVDHYLHTAHAAALLLSPQRTPLFAAADVVVEQLTDLDAALVWFGAEHRNLVAVIRSCSDGYAPQLAWTLATYFDRQGHWLDWVAVQEVAVAAARRTGEPATQAQAHRLLANALSNLRRHDEAQRNLEQALELFATVGDDAGRAHTTLDLAMLWDRQGDPRRALPYAYRSLALYRRAGSLVEQAVALNAIGWYHAELGDHRCAMEHCRAALALSRAAGSRYGEANTLDSIGFAHHHLGEYDAAVACYDEALEKFRAMGDRHAEAIVLTHVGDTYEVAAKPAAARDAWRRALSIFDDLGHADADAVREKLA